MNCVRLSRSLRSCPCCLFVLNFVIRIMRSCLNQPCTSPASCAVHLVCIASLRDGGGDGDDDVVIFWHFAWNTRITAAAAVAASTTPANRKRNMCIYLLHVRVFVCSLLGLTLPGHGTSIAHACSHALAHTLRALCISINLARRGECACRLPTSPPPPPSYINCIRHFWCARSVAVRFCTDAVAVQSRLGRLL